MNVGPSGAWVKKHRVEISFFHLPAVPKLGYRRTGHTMIEAISSMTYSDFNARVVPSKLSDIVHFFNVNALSFRLMIRIHSICSGLLSLIRFLLPAGPRI